MKRRVLANYKTVYPHFLLRMKQLELEIEAWKRLLSFLTDENVKIKMRFATALNYFRDNRLLIKLEQFNDSFISQDEMIKLMRNEVESIHKILHLPVNNKNVDINITEEKISRLRENISLFECQFSSLKKDFDNFMHENIPSDEN